MSKCYACSQELPGLIRPFHPIQLIGCDHCMNVSQIAWLDNIPSVKSIPDYPRLDKFVPKGSVLANMLDIVPKALTQLPVLAEIPQRVVKTIHSPDASLNDVAQIIKEDAVLTTKVLSLSNSAFFATVSEIVDLPTACSRLGMRTLGNIANAMAFANQYKSTDKSAIQLMQKLWMHSLASAHCAELLAVKFGLDRDVAYVTGLLHDIGKVVMIDVITTKFSGTPPRLKESPDLIARAIEPIAHLVGLHVVQYWKLAGDLTHPIFFIQQPQIAPTKEGQAMAYCVRLASDMADSRDYGITDSSKVKMDGHVSLDFFDMSPSDLESFSENIDQMLASVLSVFGSPA